MTTYFVVIGIMAVLSLLYYGFDRHGKNIVLFLMAVVLAVVSGLRYMVGTDYYQYMRNFPLYLHQELSLTDQPALTIVAAISNLFGAGYVGWFLIMAAFTVGVTAIVCKKYSVSPCYSMMLFILIGGWHGSFNLVKQYAATAVLLYGLKYIINRDMWKWFAACFVASMFHISAVIMLPVYFVIENYINKRNIYLIVLGGAAVALSYEMLFVLINSLKSGGFVSMLSSTVTESVDLMRVLVQCAPTLVIAMFRKHYQYDDPTFCTLVNLSVLNSVITIASMRSIYLFRFCVYTNIFSILLIPYLSRVFKRKGSRAIFNIAILALFFVFWMIDINKGSTTQVYQWIFR